MNVTPCFTGRLARLLFAWAAVASLAACTTMSANECKTANWFDVGLRDGLAGQPVTELDDRTRSCAEAGVQANARLYLQGRNQGLQTYCRLDNAVRLGLDGKSYQGVCAPSVEPEFRRRYNIAHEVYSARSSLRSQQSRQRTLENRVRDAATDEDRRRTREDLHELDRSLRRTRDRLRDAEWTLDRLDRR